MYCCIILTLLPWIVREQAIADEVIDVRERALWFSHPDQYPGDFVLLGQRYQHLRGAPPVSFADGLPDVWTVRECLRFNREYRDWLTSRYELSPRPVLMTALREAEQLYAIWSLAEDATNRSCYVSTRRAALRRLINTLGVDAVVRGHLPPHVPIWRFAHTP